MFRASKILIAVVLFLSNDWRAFSQDFKLNFYAGVSISQTDVGGVIGRGAFTNFSFRSRDFNVGFGIGRNNLEVRLMWVSLHDADSLIRWRYEDAPEWWRWRRGFSFKTEIIELSILKSIELWKTMPTILLTGGISLAALTNKNIGERNFSTAQPMIPISAGVRMGTIGLDICYRKTFTDLLDGYSLRADPTDNDSFFTISLSYTFKKKEGFSVCPKY